MIGKEIRKGIIIFSIVLLQGCASSNVSREASGQAHDAYENANSTFSNSDTSIAESYQNTSQRTKGIMLGGLAGAIAGSFTSGVGALTGAAGGAIVGGALGAYIDENTSLTDRIINRGNKIIVLGDQVLIVMPSSEVFRESSAQIRPQSYMTLNMVSQLISGYPNMTVRVSAYTNANGPEPINRSLSQQQAESVEKYLWRQGVNTRLIYAAGYGGMKPVAKVCDEDGSSSEDNDRIEITLEKLPV